MAKYLSYEFPFICAWTYVVNTLPQILRHNCLEERGMVVKVGEWLASSVGVLKFWLKVEVKGGRNGDEEDDGDDEDDEEGGGSGGGGSGGITG